MTHHTTPIMERYAMKRGAGPVSARMPPEPTKRPVPMAPPVICQRFVWISREEEGSRTQCQELDMTALETALKLVMAMGEVVLGIGGQGVAQLSLLSLEAVVFILDLLHVESGR
jgi:hypothetical protein